MGGNDRARRLARACVLIAVSSLSAVVHAGPLGLPDSARPGAVRPEDSGRPTMPPQPAGEVMDIPAVIDRPLEVDAGPRVAVTQFQLVDARDLPKFDVKIADLQALVDAEKEKHPEGFTIGELQEVADAVTRFYREKGLILAQGVIPVQSVQGGIVNIQVYEGRLGRVLAEGNLMYKEALLKIPFKGLIGEPITNGTTPSQTPVVFSAPPMVRKPPPLPPKA